MTKSELEGVTVDKVLSKPYTPGGLDGDGPGLPAGPFSRTCSPHH